MVLETLPRWIRTQAGDLPGLRVPLNGKRKGAVFCSDVCRKRFRVEALRIIAETRIQNSGLTDGISASQFFAL
jgi:hypothetical protein